jgi:hypothetical protein
MVENFSMTKIHLIHFLDISAPQKQNAMRKWHKNEVKGGKIENNCEEKVDNKVQ